MRTHGATEGWGGGVDVLGSNQEAAAWPPSADRPDEQLNHAAGKMDPAHLTQPSTHCKHASKPQLV